MSSTRRNLYRAACLCLLAMLTTMTFAATENGGEAKASLTLALRLDGETLDAAALPNGEWWLREALADRSLLGESRRLPPVDYADGAEAVGRLIRTEWPLAREIAVAPFPALADKASYPALRAEFLDGENEDTRQFVGALIFTDEWSFWLVLEAAADAALSPDDGADGDATTRNARLKRDMDELLIDSVAADSPEGRLPSDFGPAVHIAGPDAVQAPSVMDALIRIKKIVRPEDSPWVGPGGLAYRYDGPGTVAGAPALLFSFGADSREKFTAERHFAIDAAGTVYEMDIADGGEYWRWDERGAGWWGAYRRGDAVLRIQNYREGPSGMYFVFDAAAGGKTVFEGTAPARGRTAQYGPLVLSLADDDQSVTVTIDREAAWEGEIPVDLEGVYTAF